MEGRLMYAIRMIFHYIKRYRSQYILLFIQMTFALTLVFVIGSTTLSLSKRQNDAYIDAKTSFIVEISEETEIPRVRELIGTFLSENTGRELDYKNLGTMQVISSEEHIDDLFGNLTDILAGVSGLRITRQNTAEELEKMAAGINYTTRLLKAGTVVISAIVTVGFTGFVMLMLLRREHDMLTAYLCGASMRRLILSALAEISVVGAASGIAGGIFGFLLTPLMGSFGATGIYSVTPEPLAFGGIIILLVIIYAVPTTVFAVRMKKYNPITRIRMEEN